MANGKDRGIKPFAMSNLLLATSKVMGQKLGQHFLKDKKALHDIVGALEIKRGDVVIEIGPGHGELTEHLLVAGAKVIAIEKDPTLAQALIEKFQFLTSHFPSLTSHASFMIEGDALKVLPTLTSGLSLSTNHYSIAGNIPYYITGHLLRIVGEMEHKPERVVLTIQKEVAQRVCAQKGKMNLLAACTQAWARPKILRTIPAGSFSPPPKVDSAVLVLEINDILKTENINAPSYYAFVRALFKQPRKTILNNLIESGLDREKATTALSNSGIHFSDRPAQTDVVDIIHILRCFH